MKKAKDFLVALQGLCFQHNVKFTTSVGIVEDDEIKELTAEPDGCRIEVVNTKVIGKDRNKKFKCGVGKFGS